MWRFLRAAAILTASIVVAAVLACVTLVAFLLMSPSLLCQPPKKVYTGTQWTVSVLHGAAEAYRQAQGEWPCDDEDSTFLYKLMGGRERPPYLVWRRVGGGICATCQVYNMTSPRFSPWAQKPKGAVPNAPFYIPQALIQWPEEHGCEMTAYGGSIWPDENGSYGGPQWDKVPDDPTVYPWLAKDVVGYDLLGARYRYKKGLFGYVVYTDGENLRDNGGHWDDIHANLTLGMLAAYHPWHALLLLALALAPLFVYYRVIVRPLWIRPLRAWIEDRRRRLREGVPGCPIGPA